MIDRYIDGYEVHRKKIQTSRCTIARRALPCARKKKKKSNENENENEENENEENENNNKTKQQKKEYEKPKTNSKNQKNEGKVHHITPGIHRREKSK